MAERLNYQTSLEQISSVLSQRERQLLETYTSLSITEASAIGSTLESMGFVKCEAGPVLMGSDNGLVCSIEGRRGNETPGREFYLDSFYIAKTTVTNGGFEEFDPRHKRTTTSPGDRHPVTCVTYGRAISYTLWLREKTGLKFCLPTEPQLTKAMAPYGWHYPYQEKGAPTRRGQNVYKSYPELYPLQESGSTLEVDNPAVPVNYLGIHHPTGNVSVFTLGHYTTQGHWGAQSDGTYVVAMGGNFRLCPLSARVASRGIMDVTGLGDTVGIRLIHPDPANYVAK